MLTLYVPFDVKPDPLMQMVVLPPLIVARTTIAGLVLGLGQAASMQTSNRRGIRAVIRLNMAPSKSYAAEGCELPTDTGNRGAAHPAPTPGADFCPLYTCLLRCQVLFFQYKMGLRKVSVF